MNDDHDFCVADLRVLLHCYAFPQPFPADSPAVERAHRRLSNAGLLHGQVETDKGPRAATEWTITEKGRAHVEALLNLPLPEQVWVTPGLRP